MSNEEIAAHDISKIGEFYVTGGMLHRVAYTLSVARWFMEASEQTSTPLNFKEAMELALEFMRSEAIRESRR